MSDQHFPTIITDRVAEVTLSVGKANALSIEAALTLASEIETLGRRDDLSLLIIRNEGSSFCAGADVNETTAAPSRIGESNRAWLRLVTACHRCELPVIAAVDGHCVGGGIVLAASCDILLLSDRSTFSLPQIKAGGWGAGTFLMRLLGPLKIRSAMFTGRTLKAADIAAGGQVQVVLPADQLRNAALALAREIAQYPVEAICAGKAALNGIELLDIEESYRFEHAFTTELFVSPEAAARRAARLTRDP